MNCLMQDFNISGQILVLEEALSFWGGVHSATGIIVDTHHPQHGKSIAGRVVLMPSSRGSCTGSAVLLGLALCGKAPAALVFREPEDILTLGALIANTMYEASIAVVKLGEQDYRQLAGQSMATLRNSEITADSLSIGLHALDKDELTLTPSDLSMLNGDEGAALKIAMQTLCTLGLAQGARRFIDVTRAHIDGCIYASPANLVFAQTMQHMGAKVRVPTTMNAISVDYANWRRQGIDPQFGVPARDLADAYVAMGAEPSFTCAPYLRDDKPEPNELIAWAESNAVVYANSVLGARTNKHPDFLDLFIAMTGRAPEVAMYCDDARQPLICIDIDLPDGADESAWPLLGWLVGSMANERIPLLLGLSHSQPTDDDLKALCAAFGTSSGAPMLHIDGITPEAHLYNVAPLASATISADTILQAWHGFNQSDARVDLIALGSPHLSAAECRLFANLLQDKIIANGVDVILTVGHATRQQLQLDGTLADLESKGVQVVPDICWCSISKPLFPVGANTVMTNSGKYAHYGPALSGCTVLFGSLADCAQTASSGYPPAGPPAWLLPAQ